MIATRRMVLQMLAAVPLAGMAQSAVARESVILRLIRQGREYDTMPERLDFISRSLLGVRYQGHTLIGGPHKKELFVTRDDAFDCVTYCEAVLAAAIATNFAEYAAALRRIRYARSEVIWAERNHDFAQWNRSIVGNNICRPVDIAPTVTVEKSLSGGGLGKRRYAIAAVPTAAMMANQKALRPGDVVGFVSRRSELDFFHCGFIVFNKRGTLVLRHASQSHGRVVDEDMRSFVGRTGVKYVTLMRAEETVSAQS